MPGTILKNTAAQNFSQPEAQLIIYHSRTVQLTLTKFNKSASQLTEWNFDFSRVSIDTLPSTRPLPNRSLRRNVAPTALSAFGFFPSLFNLFTSAQLTQTSGKSVFLACYPDTMEIPWNEDNHRGFLSAEHEAKHFRLIKSGIAVLTGGGHDVMHGTCATYANHYLKPQPAETGQTRK